MDAQPSFDLGKRLEIQKGFGQSFELRHWEACNPILQRGRHRTAPTFQLAQNQLGLAFLSAFLPAFFFPTRR